MMMVIIRIIIVCSNKKCLNERCFNAVWKQDDLSFSIHKCSNVQMFIHFVFFSFFLYFSSCILHFAYLSYIQFHIWFMWITWTRLFIYALFFYKLTEFRWSLTFRISIPENGNALEWRRRQRQRRKRRRRVLMSFTKHFCTGRAE